MLALAAMAPAAMAPAARAQSEMPADLKTVAAVRFEGRRGVSGKEIRSVIKTRAASWLPWSRQPVLRLDFLRSDTLAIEQLYQQHGFLDARARYRLAPGRERNSEIVTFVIEEGQRSRIARVELEGVTVLNTSSLRRKLYARPGRPFNPLFLVADTARIADEYQERGYLPHVEGLATRTGLEVTVRYMASEGPRYLNGQTYISSPGELHVQERMIRRELLLDAGQPYRASRVQRSIERLYETGLFRQVQLTRLVDSTNTRVEFDLRLRERAPRWVDAGIGSGTAERLRATGQWGHRNLAGRGIQGVLSGKLALDGQARFLLSRAEASLLEPWFARSRTRGLLTVYYENHHDRANPAWLVVQQARGVSAQLRREFGRYTRVAITQDNVFVDQDITFKQELAQQARDSLIANVPPHYTTHRLQLAVDRDARDDPFLATRGSVQSLVGEVAGGPLRGASSFSKVQYGVAWYTPVRTTWVLATQLRAGTIDPFGDLSQFTPSPGLDEQVGRVPLEDRFRIGGVNSLRGYDENQVPASGGLAVLQANVELRIPVYGPLGIETYVDAGNVWERPAYIKGRHFTPRIRGPRMAPGDVKYVAGVGLRLLLPVGPLRLDVSWGARRDDQDRLPNRRLQFALGPAF